MSIHERALPQRFFATQTGELLIGSSAVEHYVQSGGHPADVRPLRDAITDPQFEPVNGIRTRGWTTDTVTEFLNFYARVLSDGTNSKPCMPTVNQLDQAHRYRLAPSRRMIHNITGGLSVSIKGSRLEPQNGKQRYLHLTRADYLMIARKLYQRFGAVTKPIIDQAHAQGLCPNYGAFEQRFRSASTIRELIGVGLDTRNWMMEDFVDWGVRMMQANDGWLPSMGVISRFIATDYRPSPKSIVRRFGSLTKFRRLVEEEYERISCTQHSRAVVLLGEFKQLTSAKPVSKLMSDDEKMQFVRSCKLFSILGIYDCVQPGELEMTGDALLRVLKKRSGKSVAEIEIAADEVDAIELIYPELIPDLSRFIIPEKVRRGSRNIPASSSQ